MGPLRALVTECLDLSQRQIEQKRQPLITLSFFGVPEVADKLEKLGAARAKTIHSGSNGSGLVASEILRLSLEGAEICAARTRPATAAEVAAFEELHGS